MGGGGVWGGAGQTLVLIGLLETWGAQCISKLLGGGWPLLHPPTPLVPTPMFYWSLEQTNAIFTCALSFFPFTSITESISSDHYLENGIFMWKRE